MARIATVLCGPVDDPLNPDYRSLLPPFAILANITPIPNVKRSSVDTRDLAWKVKTLEYSFNITLPNSTVIMGSGTSSPCNAVVETDLECATGITMGIRGTVAGWSDTGCFVADYDHTAQQFIYDPQFVSEGISNDPATFPTPVLTAIVVTVLGINIPMYCETGGTATGFLTIDIPATGGYWPYDNSKSALPSDGPIWDTDTGAQLIIPTPPDI